MPENFFQEEKIRREPPLGVGAEFSAARKKEFTLPAVEVAHTVVWVNPAFKATMPFQIEAAVGKPTRLGFFFIPETKANAEATRSVPIAPEQHKGRVGLLASVVFEDRDGIRYRDVDAKGMGAFVAGVSGYEVVKVERAFDPRSGWGRLARATDPRMALGLLDYEFALRDKDFSEKFIRWGIRTHRVLAIALLDEIIDENGQKISVEEAKAKGLIANEMQPVLALRAFGTRERIRHQTAPIPASPERKRLALLDGKKFVAQEQGEDPETYSWEKYADWFALTLGQQAALIRKHGLHHGFLEAHNITLDCRIVDLDSVAKAKDKVEEEGGRWYGHRVEELYVDDYKTAEKALHYLITAINEKFRADLDSYGLVERYKKSYQETLSAKKQGPKRNLTI